MKPGKPPSSTSNPPAGTGSGQDFIVGEAEQLTSTIALVVHPYLKSAGPATSAARGRSPEASLEEAVGLAAAIDLEVREQMVVPLASPRPATLFGRGKVDEIGTIVKALEIGLVVIDMPVTPIQQRNLEREWNCKVVDRTGLILEIFGKRASTREGRMQVELAHLEYQKSRLVRSWTHLERQRGGFGFLGGPGETQIEADRRVITERITRIRQALKKVTRTRTLHRKNRERVPFPVVALVGYTNAGKSTLFNRITEADVMAEDMLFATLDPTMRQVALNSGEKVIFSDTVGFISDLPTHLIAAFRATLEEVTEADIIVHVRDISHPDSETQRADVINILGDLGVDCQSGDENGNIIEVWNKSDLLSQEDLTRLGNLANRRSDVFVISAINGDGIPELLQYIDNVRLATRTIVDVEMPPSEGKLLAWLYNHAQVVHREDSDTNVQIRAALHSEDLGRLQKIIPPGCKLSQTS